MPVIQKVNGEGKKFRSPLEAKVAAALANANIPFEYEPFRFILQDGFKASTQVIDESKEKSPTIRPITYTPDFVGKSWIMEVKGFRRETFNIKWKMLLNKLEDDPIYKGYKLYIVKNLKDLKNFIADEINNN